MTDITFTTKDSEIESKEIDRLVNKNSGGFDKTTTSDGWSYKISFDNDTNAQNFIAKLRENYPELNFQWVTIK
jgi:hypothetical protein